MSSDGTTARSLGDLDPEEFRRHGHAVVDWIAGFLAAPERHPVLARVKPGDVRGALPVAAPDGPEPLDRVLADSE
jgi:aromatic-L-amino-acid decarboxylase